MAKRSIPSNAPDRNSPLVVYRTADQVGGKCYERGKSWAKTVEYAEEAGDRATHLFANREASAAYRQALDALTLLPADPAMQRRQVDLTLRLAKVTFDSVIDVLPALEAANVLARQLGDDAPTKRVAAATTQLLWLNYSRKGFS